MNSFPARLVFGRFGNVAAAIGAAILLLAGCAAPAPLGELAGKPLAPQSLNAGDVIRVSFPSTPALDRQQPQTIRRDGKITLEIVGDVDAAGKTPAELKTALIEAYKSELRTPEVDVTVVSSAFTIFVSGAVMRPGKVVTAHALTAFEGIMEAGGFAPTANPKEVVIIRLEDGKYQSIKLDLKPVLDGKPSEPFYLKPFDTIQVPTKFSMF